MNSTVSTQRLGATSDAGHAADTWRELVSAMPIVIFYRAVRELMRQRVHRRAVLDAFRR